MSAVTKITPHLSSLKAPTEIAEKPIWLIWRYEHADNEKKPRKVPYWANGGRRYGVHGRPEDRNALVTFEAARAAAARRGFTGVGLATLDGEFTVLDFDRCMVDGKLNPDIEKLAAGTYGEYSPSGEGVHIFVRGNLTGNNKSIASKDQFGIEAFATKGFVTFTGNTLEISQLTDSEDFIAPPSKELSALIKLRFGDIDANFPLTSGQQEPLGLAEATLREALDVLDNEMHYDQWLMVGMAIHHETRGEGFALWDEWSQRSSKYTGPDYGLAKWESFGRNPSRQVTIRSLIQLANQSGARITVGAVSMEEFDDLSGASGEDFEVGENMKPARFVLQPWNRFAKQISQSYLIKGLLPAAALGVLYGESGSGKSFITLDMAVSIARGIPWRGLRTTQGRVVYIVAEGAAGFRNRLIAYAQYYQLDPERIPLDIIDAAPNLLIKEDAVDLSKAINLRAKGTSLVIVDTLAQSMAGANENASDDMGKALAHCKGIHRATGAMVLLIHHSGKDSSRGARGWSGMRAAADVELEVSRSTSGRMLKTTKQKDGADFQEWGFALEPVAIGEDADGDMVTSCVAIESSLPGPGTNAKKLSNNQVALMNAASELLLAYPSGVERSEILDLALSYFPDDPKPKVKRASLDRALKNMSSSEDLGFVFDQESDTIQANHT